MSTEIQKITNEICNRCYEEILIVWHKWRLEDPEGECVKYADQALSAIANLEYSSDCY